MLTSGKVPLEKTLWRSWMSAPTGYSLRNQGAKERLADAYINRQVFPQAPSPTMTSLRRISAIVVAGEGKGQRGSMPACNGCVSSVVIGDTRMFGAVDGG